VLALSGISGTHSRQRRAGARTNGKFGVRASSLRRLLDDICTAQQDPRRAKACEAGGAGAGRGAQGGELSAQDACGLCLYHGGGISREGLDALLLARASATLITPGYSTIRVIKLRKYVPIENADREKNGVARHHNLLHWPRTDA
jgi:hypothetical protein